MYRNMDPTYRSLWKWQEAHPDQPPAPVLADRAEELGMDEFARVLQLCLFRRWVPGKGAGVPGWPGIYDGYSWMYGTNPALVAVLQRFVPPTLRYVAWGRNLLDCYAKLLYVPFKRLESFR